MDMAIEYLQKFWAVLSDMSPYLLLGFGFAGLLSVLISPQRIQRHLGGSGAGPVVKATILGVPLPLCSCGVIPVSASLRRHGASRGATAGFLLSTPQTGVDSILVTYALLGGVFAIFRPLMALASGIVGGLLVDRVARREAAAAGGSDEEDPQAEQLCREACCAGEGGRLGRILRYGFVTLPRDIGPSLLVGLAIAAALSALLPEDFFAPYLGGGLVSILALMGLGIPVYVCATASVPIAFALIAQGVSPGATFAFLVTGPATNAATLAVLWRVLGRRTALVYLLTVAATAIGGGLLLDQFLSPAVVREANTTGAMLPMWLRTGSAVALLAVLGWALVSRYLLSADAHDHEHEHEGESAVGAAAPARARWRVAGMTCSHCEQAVRRAISETPGVQEAHVDREAGRAEASGAGFDPEAVRSAIEGLGYRAETISKGV
jgi:hypothetical protein